MKLFRLLFIIVILTSCSTTYTVTKIGSGYMRDVTMINNKTQKTETRKIQSSVIKDLKIKESSKIKFKGNDIKLIK